MLEHLKVTVNQIYVGDPPPPVSEWLNPLITVVGSSLDQYSFETSQDLLAGGQVFFSGVSRFRPTQRLARLSEIILTGRKTQIKNIQVILYKVYGKG